MASGGRKPFSLSKLPQSDTRPTRYSAGDDQNDAEPQMNSSKKNVPKEVRINNWDFADWRPNSASADSKRRKKSKGNPEREREQSLSLDSPPQRDKKPRTPSTFPRTKIGPATPTSQKRALENLRSRMTFSETDEGSTDGEPNNERAVSKRRLNPPNFSRQDTNSTEEGPSQANLTNRNNNRDNSVQDMGLDSNQIVGRLMQIRDYIKQANSMRDTLHKSKEAKSNKDDMDKLKKLVDNLKEQERGYMGLLQRMLALRDEGVFENGNGTLHGLLPDLEDNDDSDDDNEDNEDNKSQSDDTVSVDLEEERTNSSSSRPYIEDKLGDTDDENESRRSSKESNNMDNTLVAQRNAQAAEWDFGVDSIDGLDNLLPGSLDAMRANELAALQQQQNLLKILADKQEQLRALQGRQDALVAMHKEAEKKLHIAQNKENKAKAAVKTASDAVRHASNSNPNLTPTDDVEEDPIADLASTQTQLEQLVRMKNRLEMLKNASTELVAEEEQAGNDMVILQTATDDEPGRQQLQDKLEDLQDKKDRMNDLLMELQTLRSQRFETLLQNDTEGATASAPAVAPPALNSRSSSQIKLTEALSTLDQADSTAESAEQVISMMDAQTKLEKLQEVKGRLDQLRGLVQYYQGNKARTDGDGGEDRDQSSAPTYSDYGDTESLENVRRAEIDVEKIFQSGSQLNALGNIPVATSRRRADLDSQQSDEDNASVNDSQMSSLGPWGDEPEIREKVRQLKATKEKLQQLQDLVSMVQQSPDIAQSLPDNISEDDRLTTVKQTVDRNISISEGEIPNDSQSGLAEAESLFSVKEQIMELSELKKERERLLALQNQLQSLQGHFDQEENDDISDDGNDTETNKKSRSQSEQGPVVTFASNDELYSKMRKQRMLREELRSKKKELEAIMKKDRNKRQYFKNQDNQSDTVSYSTDAFGASASADATMATWGGSTVDNLENITEGRDDNDDDDNDDEDDAYPSDGIVQVEEEEEGNGSDNNTYTIEADARQRRAARSKPTQPDVRPKTRKIATFPRSQSAREEPPMTSQSVNVGKKGAVRKTKVNKRTKQENYRSAEEIVRDVEVEDSSRLDLIQQQVQQTYQLLQEQYHNNTLQGTLSPNTSGLTMGNPMRPAGGMYPDMLQQQMYQQQMMMSINQCHQQLNLQQIEMSNLNHHIQQISLYIQDQQHNHHHHPINSSTDDRDHSRLTPLASSSQAHISPHHLPPPPTTRPSTFTLNPQFPLSFAPVESSPRQHLSHRMTSSSPSRQDVPQPQTNNLRPIPPPRLDSYHQNSNVNNFLGRDSQRDVRSKTNGEFGKPKKSKGRPEDDYESQGNKSHGGQPGKDGRYRPGLSSGISGTGFSDSNSVTDALSARLGEPRNRDGDVMELSLFETLRETIYSEVATLISQNESRPHFLIELFRELQLLLTDYLRQRGLYAIQELVSKTLSAEDNPYAVQSRWSRNCGGVDNLTASELTPSESFLTSEDESKGFVEKKKKKSLLNRGGSLKNNQYDYTEQAENTSTLSTPSTGLAESPFANDSLGDTVIHLDKALERMREMERKEIEEGRLDEESLQVVYNRVREARQAARILEDNKLVQGSGTDNGSQGSIPDIMYSRINSSQLDDQVKEIIREIIPVIKEHTDDICSPQLLAYIKRLVLSLTRQNDSRHEFTSFFHSQLGSILHDSLARFEGRKVRECGDDLLDSMSDALYDELAFFRMMQDLNNPNLNNKSKSNQSSKASSPQKSPLHTRIINKPVISDDGNDVSSSDSDGDSQNNLRMSVAEEENLGKERDDELANEMPIQDADEKDQQSESSYKSQGLKIELAVSETKPFTRIGSDEDDDNDSDESHSAEDPSETAVSRDAKLSSQPDRTVEINGNPTSPSRPVNNINGIVHSQASGYINGIQSEEDGDVTADKPTIDNHTTLINGDVDNNNEVTIDDLPTSLNITVSKEIEKKVVEEQNDLTGENGILSTMEPQHELAGDGTAVKDPDNFGK